MHKQEIFDKINTSIIQKLKEGTLPWQKSWATGIPINFFSKRYYSGINYICLSLKDFPSPYYITYLQAKQLGGYINSGAEGVLVVFWKFYDIPNLENEDNHKAKQIPLLRYSYAFNISQTSLYKQDKKPKIIAAETLLQTLKEKPLITNNFRRCVYNSQTDTISIPVISDFDSPDEYYSSLFHELIHWSGHSNRLKRKMFGDKQDHAYEELIAEIGSSYLCALAGIAPKTIDNQASYISDWLHALADDKDYLIKAASDAKDAVNYLLRDLPHIN